MAKATSNSNILLMGVSGALGSVVIRQTRHGTVLSQAPNKRSRRASEKQRLQRKRFREAIQYAKGASSRPEYQDIAIKRNKTPFNVATSDYLHPPQVKQVDLGDYQGAPGDVVHAVATDNVMVTGVTLTILGPDGRVIESGQMIAVGEDRWRYVATIACSGRQVTVRAVAKDLTQHTGTAERSKVV